MAVPKTSEPINLDKSIIIQDEYGSSILIGEAASKYSPDTIKRRGGNRCAVLPRSGLGI